MRDEHLGKRRFFGNQAQEGFGDRAHASHLRLLSQLIEGRAGLDQGPGAFVMMVLGGNTTNAQIRNVLRASKRERQGTSAFDPKRILRTSRSMSFGERNGIAVWVAIAGS